MNVHLTRSSKCIPFEIKFGITTCTALEKSCLFAFLMFHSRKITFRSFDVFCPHFPKQIIRSISKLTGFIYSWKWNESTCVHHILIIQKTVHFLNDSSKGGYICFYTSVVSVEKTQINLNIDVIFSFYSIQSLLQLN
jgi:hypothetical protein